MDPQQQQLQPAPIYRCKNCRHLLFRKFIHGGEDCTSLFIEQPSWFRDEEAENESKFKCPKCSTKIGQVIFSGKKCSCQEWVTPAFQVLKNKVDRIVQSL